MSHNQLLVKKKSTGLTNVKGVNMKNQNCTIEILGAKTNNYKI
jgi:hypothetical protein